MTQQKSQAKGKRGLELMMERTFFYRDGYRTLTKAVLVLGAAVVVCLILISFLMYQASQTKSEFFGLTADGRVIEMLPMSEPSMPESSLLNWAARSATCIFTYDFANYRSQLGQCQPNFTQAGWDKFAQELKSSKTLQFVRDNKLVVSASLISAPAIYDKGIIKGVMAWKVDVPVKVRYYGRQETTTEDFKVTLTIVRVNQLNRPDTPGIAISSIVSTAYREGK